MRPIRPKRINVILQVWAVLGVFAGLAVAFLPSDIELFPRLVGGLMVGYFAFSFGFHLTTIVLCPELKDYIVRDDFEGISTLRALHTCHFRLPKNWEQAEALKLFINIRSGIYLFLRIWKYVWPVLLLLLWLFVYWWWKEKHP